MSIYARLALVLVIVAAIAGAWWKFDRMLAEADANGYQRRAQEDQATAQAQRDRNLDLQRAAEKKYVVQGAVRDHFIVTTVKEITDAAAPMAACPVPDAVRLRLNAAAECASEDRPASCGSREPVPDAGKAQ